MKLKITLLILNVILNHLIFSTENTSLIAILEVDQFSINNGYGSVINNKMFGFSNKKFCRLEIISNNQHGFKVYASSDNHGTFILNDNTHQTTNGYLLEYTISAELTSPMIAENIITYLINNQSLSQDEVLIIETNGTINSTETHYIFQIFFSITDEEMRDSFRSDQYQHTDHISFRIEPK